MSEIAVPSEGTTVTRWRRYGHDRLYVKDAAGSDLGYWDLATQSAHPADEVWAASVAAAAARWLGAPAVAPEAVAPPTPAPTAAAPWHDLSTNAPGAAARERAITERDAAPVRSRLARVLDLKTDERAWRLGAVGEARVGRQLAKLSRTDPRWRALHAIPVGERGSDIDHLVVGPGGVFTINAKHHPDKVVKVCGNTVYVDGHRTDHVRNSRHESARAARLLSDAVGFPVAVEGLVVAVAARRVEVRNQPAGVHVLPRRQLRSWLERLGPSLDDGQIAAIHNVARRSTTWRV